MILNDVCDSFTTINCIAVCELSLKLFKYQLAFCIFYDETRRHFHNNNNKIILLYFKT